MKRADEADLNAESTRAGAYYIKQKFDGAPLEDKQIALNAAAGGFYMGYRFLESKILSIGKEVVISDVVAWGKLQSLFCDMEAIIDGVNYNDDKIEEVLNGTEARCESDHVANHRGPDEG